jgi:hypothetical protein
MVRKTFLVGSLVASLCMGVVGVSGVSAATARPSITGAWNVSMTMLGLPLGPSGRAVLTQNGNAVRGKLYQNGKAIDSIHGTFNTHNGQAVLIFNQLGPGSARTTVQARENPAGDVLNGSWQQGLLLFGNFNGIRGK